MIHAFRTMCPDNVCDTQPLEGDYLKGMNSVTIIEYPSLRAFLRMKDSGFLDFSKKNAEELDNPLVKSVGVPTMLIQEEDVPVTIPSPFAKPAIEPLPLDCEDPAYISARKAEKAKAEDGSECDIDAFTRDMDRCIGPVREGKCIDDQGRSCAG